MEEKENGYSQMDIDDWNQVYIELKEDLHRAIAQNLIAERKDDESANFELNEQFSRMAVEQLAECLDPKINNGNTSVCAVCKHALVRKIGKSRLACEVPGCLDLKLPFEYTEYSVEDVMNRLQMIIFNHKNECSEECRLGQNDITLVTLQEVDEEFEI